MKMPAKQHIMLWLLCLNCLLYCGVAAATDAQQQQNATYRLSLARLQPATNRVPPHLQRVRAQGYAYDDADDVIHIVEPPQHFQQLKRLINQGQEQGTLWQQQRQLHTKRPSAAPAMKVQERRPPPSAAKPAKPAADLLTQETQEQPTHLQNLAFPAGLPLQIVASVRQTQRLLHKSKPLVPHAKQRIQTKTTHSLLMQQRFERQQFERGQERRAMGQRIANNFRQSRSKRAIVPQLSRYTSEISQITTKYKSNEVDRHKSAIDQVPTNYESTALRQGQKEVATITANANQVYQRGQKLLLHITELLQNATHYLPDDVASKQTAHKADESASAATLRGLRQRFQVDTQPQQLLGEMAPAAKDNRSSGKALQQSERQLYSILEQSANTTDVIMRQIMSRQQVTQSLADCDNRTEKMNANSRLQQLQQRIACMRAKLRDLAPETRGVSKMPAAQAGSKQQRHATYNVASYTSSSNSSNLLRNVTTTEGTTLAAHNISAALLYDDVMTNIRNMLQAKNLQSLERQQEQATHATAAAGSHNISADAPRSIAPTEADQLADFKQLNQYLHELQQLVYHLPGRTHMRNSTDGTSEGGLNTHEVLSSSGRPQPDWYLINGEGKIYETPVQAKFKATASVFHRFPDIPNAELFLHNRTLAGDQPQGYEVL